MSALLELGFLVKPYWLLAPGSGGGVGVPELAECAETVDLSEFEERRGMVAPPLSCWLWGATIPT